MKNLLTSLVILVVIAGGNVLANERSTQSNNAANAQLAQTATSIGFDWPLGLSNENDTTFIDYSYVMDGFNWPEGY